MSWRTLRAMPDRRAPSVLAPRRWGRPGERAARVPGASLRPPASGSGPCGGRACALRRRRLAPPPPPGPPRAPRGRGPGGGAGGGGAGGGRGGGGGPPPPTAAPPRPVGPLARGRVRPTTDRSAPIVRFLGIHLDCRPGGRHRTRTRRRPRRGDRPRRAAVRRARPGAEPRADTAVESGPVEPGDAGFVRPGSPARPARSGRRAPTPGRAVTSRQRSMSRRRRPC